MTGDENHDITFRDAGIMTAEYRRLNPGDILGGAFGDKAILEILSQKECVGIRYYYGYDAVKREKVLVLVGVDSNDNDMVDETKGNVCKEISLLCPPRCSTPNVLNS
jgi:hypothetical protein